MTPENDVEKVQYDGKSEGKHFPYHREKVEIISTNHRAKNGNIVGGIPLVGE